MLRLITDALALFESGSDEREYDMLPISLDEARDLTLGIRPPLVWIDSAQLRTDVTQALELKEFRQDRGFTSLQEVLLVRRRTDDEAGADPRQPYSDLRFTKVTLKPKS